MTKQEDIRQLVKCRKEQGWPAPIYIVQVLESDDAFLRDPPEPVGYFYELDEAIDAVTFNWDDLHETCYDVAFITCQFPGLYRSAPPEMRLYFVWDKEYEIYVQTEELEKFKMFRF